MAQTKNIPDKKQKRERDWRKDSGAKKWADAQDWDLLKEEFCELNDDGTYTYPHIKAFIEAKYPKEIQKQLWLRRSIGLSPQRSVPWRGNWLVERELERQEHGLQAKLLRRKIDGEIDMINAASVVADSYVSWNTRVENLLGELDEYLEGKIIRPVPDKVKSIASYSGKGRHKLRDRAVYEWQQDNERRMNFALKSLSRIARLKTLLDDKYLKAIGWERPQLIAWIAEQFRIGKYGHGPDELPDAGVRAALGSAIEAIIQKSQMYEMELPDDIAEMEVDEEGIFHVRNGGNGAKSGSNGSKKVKANGKNGRNGRK